MMVRRWMGKVKRGILFFFLLQTTESDLWLFDIYALSVSKTVLYHLHFFYGHQNSWQILNKKERNVLEMYFDVYYSNILLYAIPVQILKHY